MAEDESPDKEPDRTPEQFHEDMLKTGWHCECPGIYTMPLSSTFAPIKVEKLPIEQQKPAEVLGLTGRELFRVMGSQALTLGIGVWCGYHHSKGVEPPLKEMALGNMPVGLFTALDYSNRHKPRSGYGAFGQITAGTGLLAGIGASVAGFGYVIGYSLEKIIG